MKNNTLYCIRRKSDGAYCNGNGRYYPQDFCFNNPLMQQAFAFNRTNFNLYPHTGVSWYDPANPHSTEWYNKVYTWESKREAYLYIRRMVGYLFRVWMKAMANQSFRSSVNKSPEWIDLFRDIIDDVDIVECQVQVQGSLKWADVLPKGMRKQLKI